MFQIGQGTAPSPTTDRVPATAFKAPQWKTRAPPAPTAAEESTPSPSATGLVDGVADGIVCFASKPFTTYRYILTMKSDRVKIWIENRKTKQQWDTGELLQEQIVGPDAVIPHAKLSDYVQCFYNCLSAQNSNEKSDFQRALTSLSDDDLQLELKLKLRVFTSVWTTSYKFVLKSVSLEPLDVLTSKLRDQEEEISNLRTELALLKDDARSNTAKLSSARMELDLMKKKHSSGDHAAYIYAVTAQNTASKQIMVWSMSSARYGHQFFEVLKSGKIRFLSNGLFDVFISVVNNNSNNGDTFQLQKNGNNVQICRDSNANGHRQTSVMRHILAVIANDEIAVVFTGNQHAEAGSSLILNLLALS